MCFNTCVQWAMDKTDENKGEPHLRGTRLRTAFLVIKRGEWLNCKNTP